MLTELWGFGYPLLGAIILVKKQWINNLELLGEHFSSGKLLFMNVQMFWIGIEKKTQGTAAKSLDLANACYEVAESCPLGLIYLHYTPSIWVKKSSQSEEKWSHFDRFA